MRKGVRGKDHTECMVPHFFIWTPDMVGSQGPTPAAGPLDRRSHDPASLVGAQRVGSPSRALRSSSCNEAGRGVSVA